MKHGFVTVAAVTPAVNVGDVAANTAEIIAKIRESADEGAKIIVFPELSITGVTCGDLFLQDALIKAASQGLDEIVRSTQALDALILTGLPLMVQGRVYNAAAVICRGEILGFVTKSFEGKISGHNESRWFAHKLSGVDHIRRAGTDIPVSGRGLFTCDTMQDLRVSVVIGDDVKALVSPDRGAAGAGATIICHLAGDEALAGHQEQRRQEMTAKSGSLHCGVIYANAGADESTTDQVYAGHSMIFENGNILAASDSFESDIIYSEIDVNMLAHEQRAHTMTGCHRPHRCSAVPVSFSLQAEETVLTRQYPRFPFVPEDSKEIQERCREVLAIQTYGLVKRLKHTGIEKVVLGLSGGLDSTCAILVCARAFDVLGIPRSQIMAVTMPCFGTTGRTYRNACGLAEELGAELKEISIADAVSQHFEDIEHDEEVQDATYENAQARERTQVLMDLANQIGGLHIGTGDLSEMALGWATYNGDHMSMYAVNGSVPKTLMREVVGYIADDAIATGEEGLAVILRDILETPISPELLPPKDGQIAQSTEDLVGPYELHDFFLYYILRYGFSPEKVYRIAKETFDGIYEPVVILKWLKNFYKRFFSQQFKRSCMADGPQTGTVALSPRGALVMPSDACAAVWMSELQML